MKTHEIINEIERLPQRDYNPDLLEILDDTFGLGSPLSTLFSSGKKVSAFKLPGDNNFSFSVFNSKSKKIIIIWDTDISKTNNINTTNGLVRRYVELINNETLPGIIAGQLTLSTADPWTFPDSNSYSVKTIAVTEDYKGGKIGLSLYGIALSILKLTLVAGDVQTPSGAKMWNYIYNIPGVEIRGYLRVSDLTLKNNSKLIDTIMGKLGAEYIGMHSHMHYFAFDVVPHSTKKELIAQVKSSIKLYSDTFHGDIPPIDIGLYAIWRG